MLDSHVKAICFYLPQFHPIPENDEWWGRGFTEWRNVAKAKPLFPGHYQPHLPADLGFYDLRLPEVREAQVDLARQHGIHGFCYYHYWFNGRRILERPFNEVLASGKPDFPFCLCWANENWTRVWDGGDKNVLLEQKYSPEDDLAHIESLMPAFRDERYIRVNGKPLFLVYRAELIPDPVRTTAIWREAAVKAGIGDLYLARVESYDSVRRNITAPSLGFDADVEFAPFSWNLGKVKFQGAFHRALAAVGLLSKGFIDNRVVNYDDMVRGMQSRPDVDWTRFPCVTPSWDNSARKKNASIFFGSTPEKYESWLRDVVAKTSKKYVGDEKIVFINAWNEWAEGNHLEPDLKWGRAYLEATRRGLQGVENKTASIISNSNMQQSTGGKYPVVKLLYWKMQAFVKAQLDLLRNLGPKK
jgi:lipopolysaccharide biosynthesis protein